MSINNDCFENIIGLTRNNCECLGCDESYSVSNSGLFIDELEPLNSTLIKNREDCEKGDLCQIMATARDNAITKVKTDILTKLYERAKNKRDMYKGAIGKLDFDNDLNLYNTYSGIRIQCADVKSGYLKIKNIRTVFNSNETFNIYIYNNLNELVDTIQVDSVANSMTANVVNPVIELPTHSDFVDNIEYYFIYEVTTNKPKNISISCCTPYLWNIHSPCFTKIHKGWEAWMQVSGYNTDVTNFIGLDDHLNSGYLNGLILEIETGCKVEEIICDEALNFDEPINMSIAEIVRLQAGKLIIESFLGDTEINRYILANRETLVNFHSLFTKNYETQLAFVVENIDISKNDCLGCYDKFGLQRKSILV